MQRAQRGAGFNGVHAGLGALGVGDGPHDGDCGGDPPRNVFGEIFYSGFGVGAPHICRACDQHVERDLAARIRTIF